MTQKLLQWHPAFQAVVQIELMEDRESLQFLKEYNLTDKPLRIDTLIIKVEAGIQIKKNIGRIFRQYNIVEYKGPDDYHGVNSFFKTMGYACILQSTTEREQEISPDELTVTLVSNRYPRKLTCFLKTRYGVGITQPYPGIYYISGLLFPVQLVVQKQLSEKENIWLSRLRHDLKKKEDIEVLAREYAGRDSDPLYSAAMDLIVRANLDMYKEENEMCDALNELFADKLEAKRAEGISEGKSAGIAEGIAESILEVLSILGTVPDCLQKQLLSQKDYTVLSRWLKLSLRVSSIEDFMTQIKN